MVLWRRCGTGYFQISNIFDAFKCAGNNKNRTGAVVDYIFFIRRPEEAQSSSRLDVYYTSFIAHTRTT